MYLHVSGKEFTTRVTFSYPILIVLMFYIFSIITILFVPGLDGTLFVDWRSLTAVSYLRAISAFLIAFLLPGYLMFQMLSGDKRASLAKVLVYSFILSTFFTTFLSFIFLRIGATMSQTLPIALLASNGALSVAYITKKMRKDNKSATFNINLIQFAIFLSLFFLVVYSISWINSNNFPLFPGDQMGYFSDMLKFANEPYNDPNPVAATILYDHIWWSGMLMASFYRLSGIPPLNAFIALSPLSIFTILSFYALAKSFIDKKFAGQDASNKTLYSKIPIVATVLSSFAGYGWLYLLCLKFGGNLTLFQNIETSASRTYDIYITSTFLEPIIHPTFFLVYPCFLLAISLLFMSQEGKYKKVFLITLILATLYLSHVAEFFFVLIFFLLFIFLASGKNSSFKHSIWAIFSVLPSILLVASIDVLAPRRFYTAGVLLVLPSVLITCAVIGVLLKILLKRMFIRSFSRPTSWAFLRRLRSRFSGSLIHSRTFIVGVLIYLYGLSLLISLYIIPNFNVYAPEFDIFVTGVVPWFFYPLRLGIVGSFVLIFLVIVIHNGNLREAWKFSLLFLWIPTFLMLQFFGRGAIMPEYRINVYLMVPLLIFSAYAMLKILLAVDKSKLKYLTRRIIMASFCAFIVLMGIGSTLLKFEGFYLVGLNQTPQSQPRFQTFDFLNSLPENTTVFTLTDNSLQWARSFTSLSRFRVIGGAEYAPLLFSPDDPELVFYILASHDVRYIVMNSWDFETLNKQYPSSYMAKMIDYFPIVFANNGSKIYGVPMFYPSSNCSSFRIREAPAIELGQTKPVKINCEKIGNWSNDLGTGTLEIDAIDCKEGNGSLHFYGKTDPQYGYVSLIYHELSSWDWTGVNTLEFLVKVSSSNVPNLGVDVGGKEGYLEWWKTIKPNSWTKLTISIGEDQPVDYQGGKWNPQYVNYIRFILRDSKNSTTNFWIDGIDWAFKNSRFEKSYPLSMVSLTGFEYSAMWNLPEDFSDSKVLLLCSDPVDETIDNYVNWVETGGQLVVLNSIGHGEFASILGIGSNGTANATCISSRLGMFTFPKEVSVPIFSTTSNSTQIVACYGNGNSNVSAYAFEENKGNGTIFYLEVNPYFKAMESEVDTDIKSRMFLSLVNLIKMLNLPLLKDQTPAREAPPPVYSQIRGQITSYGTTTANPQFVFSSGSSADFVALANESSELSFNNVVLQDFVINGPAEVTMNGKLAYTPSDGFYGLFQMEGTSTFTLFPDTKAEMQITFNNRTQYLSTRGGNISIVSKNMQLLSKNNLFHFYGQITLDEAYLGWTYQNPYFWIYGQQLNVNGSVNMTSAYSGAGIVIVKELTIEGESKINYTSSCNKAPFQYSLPIFLGISPWETNIPWTLVLTSWYHLSLMVIVVVVSVSFFYLFRKHEKSKRVFSN